MNLDKIIELKKSKKYEEAFSLSLETLKGMGIDLYRKNAFINSIKIDLIYFDIKFINLSLLKKQEITKREEESVDVMLELIPLAIVYDEIVLTNIFSKLIKLTLKRGKNHISPLSMVACAYISLRYYDDFAGTIKYMHLADKFLSKKDVKINTLVTYFLCSNFNHISDNSIDVNQNLLNNIKRSKDALLNDLMSLEIAKNIIINGSKLSGVLEIYISSGIEEQEQILNVYKRYALSLLGDYKGEIHSDFLCELVGINQENTYFARVLSYMYFVHISDDENIQKYDILIKRNIQNFLFYSITYQYFIYKGYYDYLKIKDAIAYKDYFKFDYVLSNLEFYKLIPNNELGNIWMFFSAVKNISIGRKKYGNKKIKKAIRRIKRLGNLRDYAMFSYLFAIYKQSRKFYRAATYNFSELERSYIEYGANSLLKQMAIEIEKRSGRYDEKTYQSPNLDILKGFDEFILAGEKLDQSIVRIIFENYKFNNISVFTKLDNKIKDHYGTDIEHRDDIAKKSVKYVFKTSKKLVIASTKSNNIRNIDAYLMDNRDSNIIILPFMNGEKVLYVEDRRTIKYSSEIELENLLYKINKSILKKK